MELLYRRKMDRVRVHSRAKASSWRVKKCKCACVYSNHLRMPSEKNFSLPRPTPRSHVGVDNDCRVHNCTTEPTTTTTDRCVEGSRREYSHIHGTRYGIAHLHHQLRHTALHSSTVTTVFLHQKFLCWSRTAMRTVRQATLATTDHVSAVDHAELDSADACLLVRVTVSDALHRLSPARGHVPRPPPPSPPAWAGLGWAGLIGLAHHRRLSWFTGAAQSQLKSTTKCQGPPVAPSEATTDSHKLNPDRVGDWDDGEEEEDHHHHQNNNNEEAAGRQIAPSVTTEKMVAAALNTSATSTTPSTAVARRTRAMALTARPPPATASVRPQPLMTFPCPPRGGLSTHSAPYSPPATRGRRWWGREAEGEGWRQQPPGYAVVPFFLVRDVPAWKRAQRGMPRSPGGR